MIDRLLEYVAPHYCYGCQEIGTVLCENCKYDIIDEPVSDCLLCGKPAGSGVCRRCAAVLDDAWCVGPRHDVLERTIDAYKFERVKSAHRALAELLLTRLPQLPSDTIVVPVPTIEPHVRQRGYDHTALIARSVARSRGYGYQPLLGRAHNGVQRNATRAKRLAQAKDAFTATTDLRDDSGTYLLIDDVVTTGATIRAAATTLRDAGAAHVYAGIIARQPLD